jgi:hypothetical protein
MCFGAGDGTWDRPVAGTADDILVSTQHISWSAPKAVDLAQIAKLLVHNQTPARRQLQSA